MTQILDAVLSIARAAGQEIRNIQLDDVKTKEDGSPLTRADMASHECIMEELGTVSPNIEIVSEEGDNEHIVSDPPSTFWLIDPLDGTKEFIKGNGEYTVNIALVEDARPVMGVIHAPQPGWTCWAEKEGGAWWEDPGEIPEQLSADRPGDAPLTAAVSRSHPSDKTEAYIAEHGIEEQLPRGSSLKFCAVARGEADVYPRPNPTCLWDTAAGTVIARKAGCRVTDLDGNDLLHDPSDGIKHHGFIVLGPRMQ
jgi:3'(2'), 5'-bisphosphate nucleotidase